MNVYTVELKMKVVVTADNPGRAITDATEQIRSVLRGNGPAFLKAKALEAAAWQTNGTSLTRGGHEA
ncbi:hypothetical protein [Agrobacterium tumefaciens]|uniref:hypothetical protein n=1 Tax=Agrobacterium tumefaciens TaxID=358 RepID=UPI0015719787|nr:hypothetical protein [Agrobacterium tumefaciens]NTD85464.1 hypothetical protein [Agrobacterium tumefaciens]NTD90813.1 hypothetical protein [Agrobacterium tumefaciens]NTD96390.1 hypothetical protein [Agrobacterium tumefaciens]NTE15887.1 hypothetical protein [Agrobacterium tumefaciens]NTE23124.1 hypothetical protein [Agrobacterium tumefaciens]